MTGDGAALRVVSHPEGFALVKMESPSACFYLDARGEWVPFSGYDRWPGDEFSVPWDDRALLSALRLAEAAA